MSVKSTLNILIKECVMEVLRDELLNEGFDPQSNAGPNVVGDPDFYRRTNAAMRQLEEDDFQGKYAQDAGAVFEGMSVMVKGYNPKRFDNLNDICNHLLGKIIGPIVNNLPDDQKAYFQKNGVQYYETIVPDGSYYEKEGPTGIINFYISGFMSQVQQQVVKAIFDELRTLGIKWGAVKKEQSGMYKSEVIRIPVVTNDNFYVGPPDLHYSNQNAYLIFNKILQYEGEHSFTMNAEELKQRIMSLSHDRGWVSKHERPTTGTDYSKGEEPKPTDDEENPHDKINQQLGAGLGANIINFGLNEQEIWQRLEQIYELADWATKHGYTEIDVG